MKSNFIITDIVRLKPGALLKQISLYLLCCIVAFTSPLCVHASEPAATSEGGSSSGEYVTINIPLTWVLDRHINFETGQEYSDGTTGSVSSVINVIPGASYTVDFQGDGTSYTTGVMSFYYNDLNYIGYQELWQMDKGAKTVPLVVPSLANNFRLTTDTVTENDNTQNVINLSITLSATYLEENNLTEETLIDVVYADEDRSIAYATDNFDLEYSSLHQMENYLLEESVNAFDDFFSSFSFSDLVEYSSGFQFLGTWFSNFYNSHSAVAVSVGMASGLVILFILLRFRGS